MNCRDNPPGTMVDSNDYINDLPNELLAKIFSALPSPSLLSSVCSHWQIVAQSTPELWVDINVPLHKSPEDCRRWTAEWIARSGILPISVIINDTTVTTGDTLPHLTNVMGLLSQHSERLSRLALYSKSSAMIERAFSLLSTAPNLQQLTIQCNGYSSSWFQDENHSQKQYSLNFPRLTILKTEGSMVSSIPTLTSLTIGKLSASYHDISQYFTASPGLQHLTLHALLPLENPPPHAALIHADSLRSLAVHLVHYSHLQESPYIFRYLAMPNLKYLELSGAEWMVSDFGQSLSFAQLDTLRISYRFCWTADTINFLHSFSTVRHLQIIYASTQGLLFNSRQGLTYNNLINSGSPSRHTAPSNLDITTAIEQTQSTRVWPELRIITLDTLLADDVVKLCDFVTSHKQLQVVELSTAARRHLSSSLRRKGDRVYQRHSIAAAGGEEGLDDIEEWLSKMVDIRTLLSPSVGLVGADHDD